MKKSTEQIPDKFLDDPVKFALIFWPDVRFYDKQAEIIRSVWANDETYVPAGNMLGKDFVAGYIALTFFLLHEPVRIVTTSIRDDHLRILWGEIDRFIKTARKDTPIGPLERCLSINNREIRKIGPKGEPDKFSYMIGFVSEKGEGMSGHHAPHTLFIGDEVSGLPDDYYTMASAWASGHPGRKRMLFIGNPWSCDNFFKRAIQGDARLNDPGGDRVSPDGKRCYRKVIRITAYDSPNVKANKEILPGLLSKPELEKRLATWDEERKSVGIYAQFYEGPGVKLFPQEALQRCQRLALELRGSKRACKGIGVDSGEGVADTSLAAVDEKGLIALESIKTADTSKIPGLVLAFMRKHGCAAEQVGFDRGGGGKQHADRLRSQGFNVRTVAFGETPQVEVKRGLTLFGERRDVKEDRGAFKNRRAEMYGELADLVEQGWAIPLEYNELLRQMSLVPREYDNEGRLEIRPKQRRPGQEEQRHKTLTEIMGRSPDDLDAVCIAVWMMQHKPARALAGAY